MHLAVVHACHAQAVDAVHASLPALIYVCTPPQSVIRIGDNWLWPRFRIDTLHLRLRALEYRASRPDTSPRTCDGGL
jgi:hypothetical protein